MGCFAIILQGRQASDTVAAESGGWGRSSIFDTSELTQAKWTCLPVSLPEREASLSCWRGDMLISVGHTGKFGHEFMEFEIKNGLLRYANNSNYKNAKMIRKEGAGLPSRVLVPVTMRNLIQLFVMILTSVPIQVGAG